MARLQQGSVAWADIPRPVGRCPIVVLTRDAVVGRLNRLTVAPVSNVIRGTTTEVVLEPADGVHSVCAVQLDSIVTVERSIIDQTICVLDRRKMLEVFAAIGAAFEMP